MFCRHLHNWSKFWSDLQIALPVGTSCLLPDKDQPLESSKSPLSLYLSKINDIITGLTFTHHQETHLF